MFRVRRESRSPVAGSAPERLPLRWGVIVIVAAGAGAAAFAAGGLLAAIGVASVVMTTLHKVLA
jgi:hypothetical protein